MGRKQILQWVGLLGASLLFFSMGLWKGSSRVEAQSCVEFRITATLVNDPGGTDCGLAPWVRLNEVQSSGPIGAYSEWYMALCSTY